jgi:hypothetical protein
LGTPGGSASSSVGAIGSGSVATVCGGDEDCFEPPHPTAATIESATSTATAERPTVMPG